MAARGTTLVVLVLVLALSASLPTTDAAFGIDVSMADCPSMTLSQWKCMRSSYNNTFAIIQTWDGGYQLNRQIATCVNNAWTAGFLHVDVYMFMCPNCGGNNPPSTAVTTVVNYLRSNNVRFGMLWFDIEQCDGCWNDDSSNIAFIRQAVNTANSLGVSVGIYSSDYEWGQTVGANTQGFPNLPLWYAHYDNIPNFSDSWAYQFGGWTRPSIKQYYDHGDNICSVNVDVDWYPD